MKSYYIKVNGKYYVGESEMLYTSETSGKGWYQVNKGDMPKLIFDEDISKAKVIESWLNLRSDIDRMLKREREKEISINLLEIIYIEGE